MSSHLVHIWVSLDPHGQGFDAESCEDAIREALDGDHDERIDNLEIHQLDASVGGRGRA